MTVRVYRELFVVSILLRLWRKTVLNIVFRRCVPYEEEMLLKVHWRGFTLLPYYGWEHVIIIIWLSWFTLSEVTNFIIIQNRWCFFLILLDDQTTGSQRNQRKGDGITSIYLGNRRWWIRDICVTLPINQVLIKERFLSLSSRILDTLALYHHRTPLWLLWDHYLLWLCNWICRLLMTRLRWRPFDHLVRREIEENRWLQLLLLYHYSLLLIHDALRITSILLIIYL